MEDNVLGSTQLSNLDIQKRILLALTNQYRRSSPDGVPADPGLSQSDIVRRIFFDKPANTEDDVSRNIESLLKGAFIERQEVTGNTLYAITEAGSMAMASDMSQIGADLITASVLRVRRIELVDNNERTRGILDTANGEHPRLLFSDTDGRPRVIIGVLENGASIYVKTGNQSGGINISVDNDSGSTISLGSDNGQLNVIIQLKSGEDPYIALVDKDGKPTYIQKA